MIFAGPILALIFGHFLSKKKKLTLWYNASSGSPSCLQSWNHGWSDGFILQNLVNFFIHRMSDFGYNLKKKLFTILVQTLARIWSHLLVDCLKFLEVAPWRKHWQWRFEKLNYANTKQWPIASVSNPVFLPWCLKPWF